MNIDYGTFTKFRKKYIYRKYEKYVENMKYMSIDDIIILYQEGHRLVENEYKSLQNTTKSLQTITSISLVFAGIVGLVIGMVAYNMIIEKAKSEIKNKCPECYKKLSII